MLIIHIFDVQLQSHWYGLLSRREIIRLFLLAWRYNLSRYMCYKYLMFLRRGSMKKNAHPKLSSKKTEHLDTQIGCRK